MTSTELARVLLYDRFADNRPPGHVVGSHSVDGSLRCGPDVESTLAIDHGAARIRPLRTPGWGRSALTYNHFDPVAGRALFLQILNGHNGSEADDLWPSVPSVVYQHVLGTRTEMPLRRMVRRSRRGARVLLREQVPRVIAHRRANRRGVDLGTNLAAGWLGPRLCSDPLGEGHGFIVRARPAVNADLCAVVNGQPVPVVSELPNVLLDLAIVLRDCGALLCLVERDGADAWLVPLAIDDRPHDGALRPGVHQAVSGQIGWRVDTRIRAVTVADLLRLEDWCTSAVVADRLTGAEALDLPDRPITAKWTVVRGALLRTPAGVVGTAGSLALLHAGEPVALLHARLTATGEAALVLRADEAGAGWYVCFRDHHVTVERRTAGQELLDRVSAPLPPSNDVRTVQVLDGGTSLRVVVDGHSVVSAPVDDIRNGEFVGLAAPGRRSELSGLSLFEAHPRRVRIPAQLVPVPRVVPHRVGARIVDAFDGPPALLDGRVVTGLGAWERSLGPLRFAIEDGAVRVPRTPPEPRTLTRSVRNLVKPEARRTAYTLPWQWPSGASISADITPPGTGRGQGERGRAGLVLWEDPDNWIIVATWLDDAYAGCSISTFYRLDGVEELYDAVWTNVGTRVTWGQPYTLAADLVDGDLAVRLDGDLVLERRVTDVTPLARALSVRRVGIVSNWEFGDDTGSRFAAFSAEPVAVATH